MAEYAIGAWEQREGCIGRAPGPFRATFRDLAAKITAFGYAAYETITEFHVFAVVLCAAPNPPCISAEGIIHDL